MQPFKVPAGTRLLIGSPAKPMPSKVSRGIAEVLKGIRGVREGHLPQLYAAGITTAPAQVLAVVLDQAAQTDAILREIDERLSVVLPEGRYLDIWPLVRTNPILPSIRAAGCQIFPLMADEQAKPWWRPW